MINYTHIKFIVILASIISFSNTLAYLLYGNPNKELDILFVSTYSSIEIYRKVEKELLYKKRMKYFLQLYMSIIFIIVSSFIQTNYISKAVLIGGLVSLGISISKN